MYLSLSQLSIWFSCYNFSCYNLLLNSNRLFHVVQVVLMLILLLSQLLMHRPKCIDDSTFKS